MTQIEGEIKFSKKKAFEIVNSLINKGEYPFNKLTEWNGLITKNKKFYLVGNAIIPYNEDIEKICLFIGLLDDKAKAEIVINGGASYNKITLKEGKVYQSWGEVVYPKDDLWSDSVKVNNSQKLLYKYTKDTKFLRQAILGNL